MSQRQLAPRGPSKQAKKADNEDEPMVVPVSGTTLLPGGTGAGYLGMVPGGPRTGHIGDDCTVLRSIDANRRRHKFSFVRSPMVGRMLTSA